MIGTTLLNDIVKRTDIHSPADILNRLDFEIKILLQKNAKDNTQDGMDISIVEIEMDTKKIRVASAKRPVYLFINNELTIYKGARRSIGDTIVDNNSPFVNIEYDGKTGDSIYLFSDGYTDQFGGNAGKKFMTLSVKELLEKNYRKPMKEQHRIIRDTFYNWKNDLDQVDDVIFMGVKL
jgi:serine phosphatase RsbU (regulator of sigma subunit)